jgi:hypothetical protein
MTRFFRSGRALTLALVALSACTNAAVDKAVGSTSGTSTVVVARTEAGISVQNSAGRPLLNIRVGIETRDGQVFLYTLPTLDAGLTKEVRFAEFRTDDGTLFEPGGASPSQIKTTARDTLGNSYDVATPWEPAPQ